MRINRKLALSLTAVAAVGLLGGNAFTASNTLPTATKAGTGTVTVTGYTATKIDYNLDSTTPTKIASVAIEINSEVPTTSNAKLQLATGGSWYDCSVGSFTTVTPLSCTTTDAEVSSANNLTLVIAD